MMKLYLDANIFLNVWFEEMLRSGRVFYYSKKLLEAIIDGRFQLVLSDLTVRELSKKTGLTREIILKEYLKPYEMVDKLTIIKTTRRSAEEAIHLSGSYGVHPTDALHAAMAKTEGCILVTRDEELRRTANKVGIRAVKPEEIV